MTFLTTLALFFLLFQCHGASSYSVAPRQSGKKAGLAWPNGNTVSIDQFKSTGKVSWYYTWSSYPVNTDLEFVPMLWGYKDLETFTQTINQTIAQRQVKNILGMNEPDQKGQANMGAAEGAEMWKAHLEPLRAQYPGLRLGSPATSSAPAGKEWVSNFLGNCSDACHVDFIALHWYGVNASAFINYVTDFHKTFQRPIWVTEWACHNFVDLNAQCSYDDIVRFLEKTQNFMDESDIVERYSWFGAMKNMADVNTDGALMDSSGSINQLGKQYIGAEEPRTSSPTSGNPDGPPSGGSGNSGGATIRNSSQILRFSWCSSFITFLAALITFA